MIKVMTILMIILMVAALIRRIRRKPSRPWREPPWEPSEGTTPEGEKEMKDDGGKM